MELKLSYQKALTELKPSLDVLLETDTNEVDLELYDKLINNSEKLDDVSKRYEKLRKVLLEKYSEMNTETKKPKTKTNKKGDEVYDISEENNLLLIKGLDELNEKEVKLTLVSFERAEFSKFVSIKPIIMKNLKAITK